MSVLGNIISGIFSFLFVFAVYHELVLATVCAILSCLVGAFYDIMLFKKKEGQMHLDDYP